MLRSLYARSGGVLLLLGLLVSSVSVVGALAVPPAPSLDRPIVDQTQTLTDEQITSLSRQIATSRTQKAYQIGILVIPTLEGRDIESYSIDVARAWGVGEKTANNGVLLVVAKDDHKLRLEVGSGLEGDITDLQSGHIIRDVIAPKFKTGDYYGGLRDGIDSIQAAVEGAVDPHLARAPSAGEGIMALLAQGGFFILWGVIWLASILARSKSWWAGGVVGGAVGTLVGAVAGWATWTGLLLGGLVIGGLLLDWLVSRNYSQRVSRGSSPSWWAGGPFLGGGGGSGSGGNFGGGGFSGGGASGDW